MRKFFKKEEKRQIYNEYNYHDKLSLSETLWVNLRNTSLSKRKAIKQSMWYASIYFKYFQMYKRELCF